MEISDVSVLAWDVDWVNETATCELAYAIAGAPASVVTIAVIGPSLNTLFFSDHFAVEVGPHTCTIVFSVHKSKDYVGAYSIVISAPETETTAARNRDRVPKPALQKGRVVSAWPPAASLFGQGSPGGGWFYLGAQNASGYLSATQYTAEFGVASVEAMEEGLAKCAVVTYVGHADENTGQFLDLGYDLPDGSAAIFPRQELDGMDLDHVRLAIWQGCSTARPIAGPSLVTSSVNAGVDCSLGWYKPVGAWTFPTFSDHLWYQLVGCQQDVETAVDAAAWDTWIVWGHDPILSFWQEGNTTIVPECFGE